MRTNKPMKKSHVHCNFFRLLFFSIYFLSFAVIFSIRFRCRIFVISLFINFNPLVCWLYDFQFIFSSSTLYIICICRIFNLFHCSNHCTIITEVYGPQQKKIKQTRKGNQCSFTKNIILQWQHCDVHIKTKKTKNQ